MALQQNLKYSLLRVLQKTYIQKIWRKITSAATKKQATTLTQKKRMQNKFAVLPALSPGQSKETDSLFAAAEILRYRRHIFRAHIK